MRFRDREEAGRLLAQHLLHLKDTDPVVLALPRGGVPVALPIAEVLGGAPLDLLLVRKIGAPFNPEYGIGAVVDGDQPETVLNEDAVRALGVPPDWIARESARELEEIERRRALYLRGRRPAGLRGRTAVVVDDGIATGGTVRVALQALARSGAPRRIVLAAPVAPADTAAMLRESCDEAVFLHTPEDFGAVGYSYDDFRQIEDAEVIALLDCANTGEASRRPGGLRRGAARTSTRLAALDVEALPRHRTCAPPRWRGGTSSWSPG
jgi:putative phosphoribosyl transferase